MQNNTNAGSPSPALTSDEGFGKSGLTPHNFVLVASGHYAHVFTEELATALRESVKQHMAAYVVTGAACSVQIRFEGGEQ